MIWLHRYARVLAAATFLLVIAGGMVTSVGAGLSVPDWPTTYGRQMFAFPLSGMVGGILYEHGHRLIASVVGMLTVGLVVFLWRAEPRAWVRHLGWAALVAVCLQGLLGGLTVLLRLPTWTSTAHAGLAQAFFCIVISLAIFTSPRWRTPASPPVDDRSLRRGLVLLTGAVYGQILLGAAMRHSYAGLAIPDFPLSFGRLIPPIWTPAIALNFAHRVGALVVAVLAVWNVAAVWRRHADRPELSRLAWLLACAVALQLALGGLVILTQRQPVINTAHVANGALVLATSLALTLRAFRVGFAAGPPHGLL